ncbi:MAG: rod shape-determining protein MreD [Clostridia bacterium]
MNKPLFYLIGILLTLFQMFFANIFDINGVVPNIPMIYLILVALYYGEKETIYLAFILGIIKDLYYYSNIGVTTFIYVIIVYIIGYNKNYFFNENLNIALLFVGLATVFLEGYFFLTSMIFISTPYDLSILNVLVRLVYNMAVTSIFFIISKYDWKQVIQ